MNRRNGYSMVELLIVSAIVLLLAALLMPVVSAAKARGNKAVCISNLRQLGMAILQYKESEGDLPASIRSLADNQGESVKKLIHCPSEPFKDFASRTYSCAKVYRDLPSSYDTMLGWSSELKQKLMDSDSNHGVVACRCHGNRSQYFGKGLANICAFGDLMFEGPLHRLCLDGSVQQAKLPIRLVKTPGAGKAGPSFSRFDLFSDKIDHWLKHL